MTQINPAKSSKAAGGKSLGRLAATLAFDGSVDQVRAVSGERCAALGKMGIRTVRDLLTHFPRRYVDMSETASIADAQIGTSCTISAQVYEIKVKKPKPRLVLVEITLVDGTSTMIVTCFRQPWLADKLQQGSFIAVSGKVEFGYGFKRMTNPLIEQIEPGSSASGVIIPVHPASEKIQTAWMRRLIGNALELCSGLDDPIPLGLRQRYRLVSRQSALRSIHFPVASEDIAQARRRLIYEELLLLELHLMMRSGGNATEEGSRCHVVEGPCSMALQSALPFRLTEEQNQARMEIAGALAAPRRANHMLLGDVGTGKTAVAAFALAAAADSGTQALMMAPTEVLASQYAEKLGPLLDEAEVTWALLTGSTPADLRAVILQAVENGSITVLFGTHALLEPDVRPADCSVVIIDEQQRFGVNQRKTLVSKGKNADVLSLTATPIPRSLALALYGDMTLSYIRHRPLNRAGTQTRVFSRARRGEAYEIALAELNEGRQVYVVCPLVGQGSSEKKGTSGKQGEGLDDYIYSSISIESEDDIEGVDMRAALQQAQFLQDKVFPGYEVGVLHGKMKGEQKQETMARFKANEIQVLVSTTVIEVGVDVPNATVMIVEDADCFGLAQLHQLRGRVGRGTLAGHMCLISGSKAPAAIERLAAMEKTEDGFELAEHDLSLRREGDILGNRQHGASVLKLVNVVRDSAVIEAAHADAEEILLGDPKLEDPQNRALRYELDRVFADREDRKDR